MGRESFSLTVSGTCSASAWWWYRGST